jgi:hypothetical protein
MLAKGKKKRLVQEQGRKQPTLTDKDRYEDFLRSLRLVAIGLINSASSLDRRGYYRLSKGGTSNEARSITAEYEVIRTKKDFFDAASKFRFVIRNKATGSEVLVVESTYQIHFHGAEPIEKDFAARFAASELRLLVWPYFRQMVWDVTARMAIRPIVIPLAAEVPE